MRTILGVILIGAGVAAAASSTAGAPEQPRPAQITEARVWVENRGREQAVPVALRGVTMDTPIRVQVVNGDVNARAPEAVLVRHARQM
jgi:maltose-binding protein MalE